MATAKMASVSSGTAYIVDRRRGRDACWRVRRDACWRVRRDACWRVFALRLDATQEPPKAIALRLDVVNRVVDGSDHVDSRLAECVACGACLAFDVRQQHVARLTRVLVLELDGHGRLIGAARADLEGGRSRAHMRSIHVVA
jgi:hypothetical protein